MAKSEKKADDKVHPTLRQSVQFETPAESVGKSILQKQQRLPNDIEVASNEQADLELEGEATQVPTATSSRKAKSGRLMLLGFVLLVIAGSWELVNALSSAWMQQDWLAGIWILLIALVLGATAKALLSEWRGLRYLDKQQHFREQSHLLFNSPGIGQSQAFCQKQIAFISQVDAIDVAEFQQSVADYHSDKEIIMLFEKTVIKPLDKQVTLLVSQHASACAALIAVSPFALLDMLIVLWRNLIMIQQISRVYGLNVGYWSRIKLIQRVFKLMLFAGTSEILADAGSYALGGGITNKLSARLAQGMGAGVIAARIGIRAMHECRPMPFLALPKPGISSITQSIFNSLKEKSIY